MNSIRFEVNIGKAQTVEKMKRCDKTISARDPAREPTQTFSISTISCLLYS